MSDDSLDILEVSSSSEEKEPKKDKKKDKKKEDREPIGLNLSVEIKKDKNDLSVSKRDEKNTVKKKNQTYQNRAS